MGSRGSVIPFFLNQKQKGYFTVTDKKMTRFMIDLNKAVKMVINVFKISQGGKFSLVNSIYENNWYWKLFQKKIKLKIIGIRPGEKIHEQMIGIEDAPYTYEYKDYFKILPAIYDIYKNKKFIKKGKKVKNNFIYS